jgi:hypothetical protein
VSCLLGGDWVVPWAGQQRFGETAAAWRFRSQQPALANQSPPALCAGPEAPPSHVAACSLAAAPLAPSAPCRAAHRPPPLPQTKPPRTPERAQPQAPAQPGLPDGAA